MKVAKSLIQETEQNIEGGERSLFDERIKS
jgi:hypothetical protein